MTVLDFIVDQMLDDPDEVRFKYEIKGQSLELIALVNSCFAEAKQLWNVSRRAVTELP